MAERLITVLPWLVINLIAVGLAAQQVLIARANLAYARHTGASPALILLARDLDRHAGARLSTALAFLVVGVGVLALPGPWAGWLLTIGFYVVAIWLLASLVGSRRAHRQIVRDLKKE